jgi:hypothetical protein
MGGWRQATDSSSDFLESGLGNLARKIQLGGWRSVTETPRQPQSLIQPKSHTGKQAKPPAQKERDLTSYQCDIVLMSVNDS